MSLLEALQSNDLTMITDQDITTNIEQILTLYLFPKEEDGIANENVIKLM